MRERQAIDDARHTELMVRLLNVVLHRNPSRDIYLHMLQYMYLPLSRDRYHSRDRYFHRLQYMYLPLSLSRFASKTPFGVWYVKIENELILLILFSTFVQPLNRKLNI